MQTFTFEEMNLLCIYNTGTREGLIAELQEMRGYLGKDETELLVLTDSALQKLGHQRRRFRRPRPCSRFWRG